MEKSKKNKKSKNPFKFLTSSRLVLLVGIVLLILVSIALGKELIRKHEVNQEIEKVQSEIDRLERKNKELSSLTEYLNTEEFKEIQARQNLNLQKEGETAVAITVPPTPNNDEGVIEEEPVIVESKSNIQKWWEYFFYDNEA